MTTVQAQNKKPDPELAKDDWREQYAYTLNNLTAKKNHDGSVTVQFGGCDVKTPNCLPVTSGWNYIVRLYRPRKEILDGTWKFRRQSP